MCRRESKGAGLRRTDGGVELLAEESGHDCGCVCVLGVKGRRVVIEEDKVE